MGQVKAHFRKVKGRNSRVRVKSHHRKSVRRQSRKRSRSRSRSRH